MASVPTQNKARVTFALDGVDIGAAMTKSGGQVSGELLKIRPAGGDAEIPLSSIKSYDDVVVSILYTDEIRAKRLWIDSRVNKAEMVVSEQPLDADDNAYGTPDVYRGLLTRFTPPDRDANANTEAPAEFAMSVGSWA